MLSNKSYFGITSYFYSGWIPDFEPRFGMVVSAIYTILFFGSMLSIAGPYDDGSECHHGQPFKWCMLEMSRRAAG